MTVNTSVIRTIMQNDVQFVPLPNGLRLQVLPSIPYLANCQRHQNAAFIHDLGILVVWADNPKECAKRAKDIEQQLIQVFSQGMSGFDEPKEDVMVDEKPVDEFDPETGVPREDGVTDKPRRIKLNQAVLCAATLFLIVAALASGWRQIAIELTVDKSWVRLAFVAVMPLQIWLALVCKLASEQGFDADRVVVLHAVCRGLRRPAFWSHRPDESKLKVLLRKGTGPSLARGPSPRYDSMPRIQGRPVVSH